MYGALVGLGNAHTIEYRSAECAGERITCAYCVSHFNLRSGLERHGARCEHIAAVGAAGEHEHVEVVLAEDEPALVLEIHSWITEHPADEHQFLVVNLQHVGALERLLDNLLGVEILTQVDVEDAHAVLGNGIEETVDGLP